MVAPTGLPGVSVREWAAWAPGLTEKAHWISFFKGGGDISQEGSPEAGFIPSLLRRRMSRLNRMALTAAFSCCRDSATPPDGVPLVLASRHGDMPATVRLLKQLSLGEPLSPADFTHSVHHTAAGYWGIISGNRLTARAVAGGEASFCYGWLEAVGLLARNPGRPVLLVVADDILPAPFDGLVSGRAVPYAVALLLQPGTGTVAREISLELDGALTQPGAAPTAGLLGMAGLDFLRWYLGGADGVLTLDLDGRRWRWIP